MSSTPTLKRELGMFGAVMLGLGSIVGTGVFVSIGIAAGIVGPAVVLAVALAAVVATLNGLSSAQLAANHAVSGGTYEYGYRFLNPAMGFTAGWMFLIAKSASAATAALGFAGYVLSALEVQLPLIPVALAAVALLTLVVLGGIRRSSLTNTIIVSVTLASLGVFVVVGLPLAVSSSSTFTPFFQPADGESSLSALFYAAALMFVAYTGYGRIATLGEEVRRPQRTIPRAIIVTLITSMVLYISVAFVGVGAVGASVLSGAATQQAAPLAVAARAFGLPWAAEVLAVGAVTAMLGVLLNLLLGLSRVLLAMGRRGDMPRLFGRLDVTSKTPRAAVVAIGCLIAALTLLGDVKTTWSFSAFTVLIYYALTNLAALFIPAEGRLFPRWLAAAGLVTCLGLAFFVEPVIWLVGLGLILVGLLWHVAARHLNV